MTKKTTQKVGALTVRAEVVKGQGTGNWFVDVPPNFNGNEKRRRHRHPSKSAAMMAARQMNKDLQLGEMMQNQGQCGLGLHDVFGRWLEGQQLRVTSGLKKESSLRTDLNGLRHVMGFFKDEDISKINAARIEAYQRHRLGEQVKPVTINTECRKLRALMNWCHNHRLIEVMPKVPMLNEVPVDTEVPMQDEIVLILQQLPEMPAVLTRLMIETGLRPSEAKRLKWDAIDLDRKVLKVGVVNGETPKTGLSNREMAFGDGLAADLLKLKRSTNLEWVFPNRDGKNKPMDNYRKSLKSAVKRSGVERYGKPMKFTPKYARKAFTSYQYLRGVPLSTIKKLVGHSPNSRVTEAHYLHIPESSLRNTVFELDIPEKPE
ncbi:site-specific recombinase XerD [Litoreibacter meonggei]|uniref:Site-specific recombinase XerD n=1 Tax=Litoreibacter meonggei TaxID=1049199 RepID=A0A497WY71_9RHOB|nr:site-specific integrase [Litoreibacter meonggei]RLJ59098.1 site-specific recombinase XerD [Litoreibacter meonggei]